MMDHLWAPWRLSYVATAQPPADDCFLCRVTAGADDRTNLVAHRTALSVVVLNRFPYNNGHLLVAPRAHKPKLDDLTPEELLDGLEVVRYLLRCLDVIIRPEGYNVGLNLGKVAGAGLPGHLHWHIVPRWNGDTNFMTTVSDARVIVQSLDALWELLTSEIASRSG